MKVVTRTVEVVKDPNDAAPLFEDDRQAMRAFLQRGETRLSTYQRVAGVFLNGAGLLILLPGLARDSISGTLAFVFSNGTSAASPWLLLLPFLLATAVPLYAFYLLLEDIVKFYFSPRFLETDPIRVTRFSLAGLTLPYDESVEAKAQVIAMKVRSDSYAEFIGGGTSPDTLSAVHRQTAGGRTAFPLRYAIMKELERDDPRKISMTNAGKIGIALSLAGSLDASLVGEVARMEASIARHVLLLRKLVLRYSKALLIFVVTTLALLIVAAILAIPATKLTVSERMLAAFVTYALWSGVSWVAVRQPLRWVEQLVPATAQETKEQTPVAPDADLQLFESRVSWILVGAFASSVGLAMYTASQIPTSGL